MHAVFFALWIIAFLFALWLQFRYKDANYPGDWRWRTKLFASGAAIGVFGAVAFLLDADPKLLLAVTLFGGLFNGFLFGFASPHYMKGLYPKRPNDEPTHIRPLAPLAAHHGATLSRPHPILLRRAGDV